MNKANDRNAVTRISRATGGALALCAAVGTGSAQADTVVVDIPDVNLLALTDPFLLAIGGDDPQFAFFGLFNPDNPAEFLAAGFSEESRGRFVAFLRDVTTSEGDKEIPIANALAAGDTIDASRNFLPAAVLASFIAAKQPSSNGEFTGGIAYLGIEFVLNEQRHFGWIEVLGQGVNGVTLRCYGYEDVAGRGVTAPSESCNRDGRVPEPATLALLIAGAAGVAALRRRQRSA